MCGIAGAWDVNENPFGETLGACARLRHRGPDGFGAWFDEGAGLALGHTRLAVVDLTSAGSQPMSSSDGRFVVALNGEIYNHLELRERLESQGLAPRWKGRSDTETLLACVSGWGFPKALQSAVGMFAVALWDKKEKCLLLARDRLGEKPMHYALQGGAFLFSSEIKAMRAFRKFRSGIDRDSLARYMSFGYIDGPRTIYEGVLKLLPGTCLRVERADLVRGTLQEPVPYWSALGVMLDTEARRKNLTREREAVEALEGLLAKVVRGQMLADVPLGAFLSGGVDSSTVVALLQEASPRPVKTFTVGFREERYDEAAWARNVAGFLGTDHTELYITPAQVLEVVPRLPQIYDEPFADPSQVPTAILARLAKEKVTVALSGDGGDELFGGYLRYAAARRRWARVRKIPRPVREAIDKALACLAGGVNAGNAHRMANRPLAARNGLAFYRDGFLAHWDPREVILGAVPLAEEFHERLQGKGLSFTEEMMALDVLGYLPDNILVKVDRAAMAVSLETRAPLLDHRVFEFAWSLPERLKISGGKGKRLLRELLYRHLPRELVDRPKKGFDAPIASWLRGPLRGWAEDLVSESRLEREGIFDPSTIRKKFDEHLSEERDWSKQLWQVLMFQAWLDG